MPPVQTAGRGRAQQRRGAHSTCKLILEMCASFLILKLLNPHMFCIYTYMHDYPYHHWFTEVWYACFTTLKYENGKRLKYDSHAWYYHDDKDS